MRKKLSIAGLLVAWLCANGALLDVAQIFAWGRMFAGYTESMTLTAALRETFDPAKPCPICLSVAKAKKLEQKQEPVCVERSAEKFVLVCESPAKVLFADPASEWPALLERTAPDRTEPVPVPPPRV